MQIMAQAWLVYNLSHHDAFLLGLDAFLGNIPIFLFSLIGGAMVTIGMTFVLYMDNPMPQYVMTSVLSLGIGLLLFLMAVLNRPFVGPLGLEPEPYEASLKLFDQIDDDFRKIATEEKPGGEKPGEHKEGAASQHGAAEAKEHK